MDNALMSIRQVHHSAVAWCFMLLDGALVLELSHRRGPLHQCFGRHFLPYRLEVIFACWLWELVPRLWIEWLLYASTGLAYVIWPLVVDS